MGCTVENKVVLADVDLEEALAELENAGYTFRSGYTPTEYPRRLLANVTHISMHPDEDKTLGLCCADEEGYCESCFYYEEENNEDMHG